IGAWLWSTATMAVPPCYADLGKSAKDIFNKGYGMDTHTFMFPNCHIPFPSSLSEFMSLTIIFRIWYSEARCQDKVSQWSGKALKTLFGCFLNKA
ncbi:unnamed protein product, partial [Tetraodon nigroviridis]